MLIRDNVYYQKLPSLREYLLISQEMMQVELFRKNLQHKWEYDVWDQPTDVISLVSIEFTMAVEELYRRISFGKAKRKRE